MPIKVSVNYLNWGIISNGKPGVKYVGGFCWLGTSFNPEFTLSNLEAPLWLEFFAVAPSAANFRVESSASTPGLIYTVEAFNFVTNSYDVIGTEIEDFGMDQLVEFVIDVNEHIDVNGDVRSRVGWRQDNFILNFPWTVNVDQMGWTQ